MLLPHIFVLWKFQTNERFIKSQWYKSKDFINIYKETIAKPFYFLVIDTNVAIDHTLRFRKNLSEIL